MSIDQKSGQQTFRLRFVSGSLFVSPCPPECNFQSETKIEPDLRLRISWLLKGKVIITIMADPGRTRFSESSYNFLV